MNDDLASTITVAACISSCYIAYVCTIKGDGVVFASVIAALAALISHAVTKRKYKAVK